MINASRFRKVILRISSHVSITGKMKKNGSGLNRASSVDADEIRKNDFDLSINKYKEIIYEPVEYDPPEVILDRIDEMEKEIQENMAELRKLLDVDL